MTFDAKVCSRITSIALTIAFVHCGGSGDGGGPTNPPPPPPTAITITTSLAPPPAFIPASTALAVGGTVMWTNTSPAPVAHDLVATTSNWQLGRTLGPGESFQTTIPQAGIHRYQCTIHPGMNGSIEVR